MTKQGLLNIGYEEIRPGSCQDLKLGDLILTQDRLDVEIEITSLEDEFLIANEIAFLMSNSAVLRKKI